MVMSQSTSGVWDDCRAQDGPNRKRHRCDQASRRLGMEAQPRCRLKTVESPATTPGNVCHPCMTPPEDHNPYRKLPTMLTTTLELTTNRTTAGKTAVIAKVTPGRTVLIGESDALGKRRAIIDVLSVNPDSGSGKALASMLARLERDAA